MTERTNNLAALVYAAMGLILVAGFYEIEQTVIGRHISYGGSWGESPRSEIYFWLATTFLLLPGGFALGRATTLIFELDWVDAVLARIPRWSLVVIGALLVAGFAALNRFVLFGLPFTDDEWGARFGGELLARGRLSTEAPEWFDIAPNLFLYLRDGQVGSFDWLGAMVPWALGTITGLDGLWFSIAAAATVVAAAWAVALRHGRRWGVFAGIMFLSSPMAVLLSATTHTHVWSRCFLAIAIACLFAAFRSNRRAIYAAAGLAGGMAWITRPIEVTALLAPLAIVGLIGAWREPEKRVGLATFLACGAIFVALFVAHDLALTGTILPARLVGNNELVFPGAEHFFPPFAIFGNLDILRGRFGANLSYNLMMLGVYGLSLPGILLAAYGVRDRITVALAAGLALAFAIALLHDDYGLHMVGPIHYSDAFIPFLILVVSGLQRIWQLAEDHGVSGDTPVHILLIGLAIWGAVFTAENFRAMQRQGQIHQDVYTVVDTHPDAIILTERYHRVWQKLQYPDTGTYVYDWRKDLGTDGRSLIVHWKADGRDELRMVQDAFPNRTLYRLTVEGQPPKMLLRPVKSRP